MAPPKTITELCRFLGMANQLEKFSPPLTELSQPLRELLSTTRAWVWGPDQEHAFSDVKTELTQSTVLALYDPEAAIKEAADSSSFGLGVVLLQQSSTSTADCGVHTVTAAARSSTSTAISASSSSCTAMCGVHTSTAVPFS